MLDVAFGFGFDRRYRFYTLQVLRSAIDESDDLTMRASKESAQLTVMNMFLECVGNHSFVAF